MGSDLTNSSVAECSDLFAAIATPCSERRWYAIYTLPQNEKSVLRRLELKGIETFLPTFETLRGWKNRQSVQIELRLFPTYLFACIELGERVEILECSEVLRIVGYGRESVALSDDEVAFLRSRFCGRKPEPFRDLLLGQRVRIKDGTMQGVEGVPIRRSHNLPFVLTIKLISQHAAVEVSAESLERFSDWRGALHWRGFIALFAAFRSPAARVLGTN